jgi:DNA-binding NtrC family response regulator
MLITDVVMPGMTGKTLLDEMQRRYPGLKYLFVSGYNAEVIAHQGVLPEGVEFLQKPFAIGAIAEKVRKVLEAPGRA